MSNYFPAQGLPGSAAATWALRQMLREAIQAYVKICVSISVSTLDDILRLFILRYTNARID